MKEEGCMLVFGNSREEGMVVFYLQQVWNVDTTDEKVSSIYEAYHQPSLVEKLEDTLNTPATLFSAKKNCLEINFCISKTVESAYDQNIPANCCELGFTVQIAWQLLIQLFGVTVSNLSSIFKRFTV
jgi:hypothetical protein